MATKLNRGDRVIILKPSSKRVYDTESITPFIGSIGIVERTGRTCRIRIEGNDMPYFYLERSCFALESKVSL